MTRTQDFKMEMNLFIKVLLRIMDFILSWSNGLKLKPFMIDLFITRLLHDEVKWWTGNLWIIFGLL